MVLLFIFLFSINAYTAQELSAESETKKVKQLLRTVDVEKSEKPLFEFGIVGGGGYSADYPAADEGKVKYLVLPYLRYRGQILRLDEEEGLRARVVHKSKWDFDLSASASFPASSSDNRARKGMESLDWIGEFGPRILYYFWDEPNKSRLRFGLPLRAVLTTDFTEIEHQGYVLAPSFLYECYHFFKQDWHGNISITSTFTDERFADYFYEVSPRYATAERPEYNAQSGYMGTHISLGLEIKVKKNFYVFNYVTGNFYYNSANDTSPLFRSHFNPSGFIAFLWLFHESEKRGFE